MQDTLSPETVKRLVARLPHKSVPAPHAFVLAVVAVATATAMRFVMTPFVGEGVPFVTYFPAVLIVAILAGAFAGCSVLLLSSATVTYLWLTPRTFDVGVDDVAALVSYWVTGGLVIAVATLLRALIGYLVTSEARAHVVSHEMRHRVGNILAVIQAIARQTRRGAATLDEFGDVFQDRLSALARAQDVIQEHPNLPTDLRQLISRVIQPFGAHRFTIGGPETGVDAVVASSLALLVHEMGTNAMKYGALSNETGTVSFRWMHDVGRVVLTWIEAGGPPVVVPESSGFGSKLLQTAFPADTGDAQIEYAPQGVRCTISFVRTSTSSPIPAITWATNSTT